MDTAAVFGAGYVCGAAGVCVVVVIAWLGRKARRNDGNVGNE